MIRKVTLYIISAAALGAVALYIIFWLVATLNRGPEIDWDCVDRVSLHPYCSSVGGARDACKSIMKQECFANRRPR